MRYLLPLICLLPALALGQAAKSKKIQAASPGDFKAFTDRFFASYWRQFPGDASSAGLHAFDSVLVVPDDNYRTKAHNFYAAWQDSIARRRKAKKPGDDQIDLKILANQMAAGIWELDTARRWAWNAAQYNVCGDFAEILANDQVDSNTRVRNLVHRLARVPAFYLAARQNLQHPTKEHTELAIAQNEGGVSVFDKDLPEAIRSSDLLPAAEEIALERCEAAAEAVRGYVAYLKARPEEAPRSFRLGGDLYKKAFAYNIQAALPPEQIYLKALARKRALQSRMGFLSHVLWPKYLGGMPIPADTLQAISLMLEMVSQKHCAPDSFQATIEAQIPQLTAFVKEKNLVYMDPTKPLVVRREPAYMAGVAGASISSPGPFDKNGNTYYNVGSLQGWDAARAESYLREYNAYTLQILNIHEAIPGHYVQLVYANKSPSLVKTIFGNGAMVEGWAVYTEQMMLDAGYGMPSPELQLMYYKWNLRTVCNFLLDYGVHVADMSEKDAMHLLQDEAFQQKAEAEGKWRRVQLTSVQLTSYYTGFAEILDLREAWQKKQGPAYNLKAFNERFLSYGSAPVKYIREAMFR